MGWRFAPLLCYHASSRAADCRYWQGVVLLLIVSAFSYSLCSSTFYFIYYYLPLVAFRLKEAVFAAYL